MPATQAPIEVDGATLVVVLGSRPSMGFVAEDNSAGAGHFEPAIESHRLCLEDVRPAEQIPKSRLTFVSQKVANLVVYSVHGERVIDLDEGGIPIVAAVLNQSSIAEAQERRTLAQPFLPRVTVEFARSRAYRRAPTPNMP